MSFHELLAQFDPSRPLAKAETIPSQWYTSDAITQAEKLSVFAKNWIYAGRTDQVSEPGMFFTFDLAGDPILVTRDKTGDLRAFVNVCRHRAARVECRSHGKASRFRCRYHGWAYDLTGRLAGAPDFDDVEEFTASDLRLPPLKVETIGPFVFVTHYANPKSLAEFLAPMPDRPEFATAFQLTFASRREYVMDCNWKLFIDNYLDGGYHVPTLHPALSQAVDMTGYRTHLFNLTNVQESPLKPPRDPLVAKTRKGNVAYYWWAYPNFMVNVYDGVMDTNVVYPLGPDKCLCVFDFYFAKDIVGTPEQLASVEVAHQVQLEDMDICHEVQRGLSTRHFSTGRYSVRREAGGYHFHRLLAADLRQAPM